MTVQGEAAEAIPGSEQRWTFDGRAAVWGGIVGGVVYVVLQIILTAAAMGGGAASPLRRMAGIISGRGVFTGPVPVGAGVIITGFIVHFVLAIIYGLILGLIIARMRRGWALLAGLIFGLALYFINFYFFTAVFPWFANARTWVTVVSHLAYGLVAAWVYVALRRPSFARMRYPTLNLRRAIWDGTERRHTIGVWEGPERRRT
ncbi:MAG TPA: hypothetical protein VFW66_03225 [Gemmatimonadales bacterium]|nr:hypothetical protein [Gemmatimonadales bacterium]